MSSRSQPVQSAKDKDAVSPHVARDNGALAVIDGGRSQGMLAMHAATELAIQRAQLHGSGIIAVNNISSATGALGWAPLHTLASQTQRRDVHLMRSCYNPRSQT